MNNVLNKREMASTIMVEEKKNQVTSQMSMLCAAVERHRVVGEPESMAHGDSILSIRPGKIFFFFEAVAIE